MSLLSFRASPLPFNSSPTFGASSLVLNLPLEGQRGENWCWAACASMVCDYHSGSKGNLAQCALASAKTSEECCSSVGISQACDVPATQSEITSIWAKLNYRVATVNDSLNKQEVADELRDGRPIQAGLHFGFAGHVVLVGGFRANPDQYFVVDPAPVGVGSMSWITPEFLKKGLGMGNWICSWTGLGK